MFAALPEALKEGWEVKAEDGTFKDSEELRRIRFGLMHVQHPALQAVKRGAIEDFADDQKVLQLLLTVNPDDVNEDDMGELLFAVGPVGLGGFIANLLPQAGTDEHLNFIASLTNARHELFASFVSQ